MWRAWSSCTTIQAITYGAGVTLRVDHDHTEVVLSTADAPIRPDALDDDDDDDDDHKSTLGGTCDQTALQAPAIVPDAPRSLNDEGSALRPDPLLDGVLVATPCLVGGSETDVLDRAEAHVDRVQEDSKQASDVCTLPME